VVALPGAGDRLEMDGMMADLAAQFLTESDRERIVAAVQAAEKSTSGEIVPMVVASSYHYPVADHVGALTLALPAALIGTPLIGTRLWLGSSNMWVFIGLFTVLFSLAQVLVKRWPALKRLFLSRREVNEEVEEAAVTAFFRHALYRTREATGVLIFVSVFERKVWVLADRGINAKVEQSTWDAVIRGVVAGIKAGRQGDALCDAVRQVGDILAEHFPVRADDEDELEDLIIES
jgi:putative membrane protein